MGNADPLGVFDPGLQGPMDASGGGMGNAREPGIGGIRRGLCLVFSFELGEIGSAPSFTMREHPINESSIESNISTCRLGGATVQTLRPADY
jgi:hypothetical protein